MSSKLELLKQLRDITGAGILDCKKYLVRASNNLDDAIKLMRSEEGVKADKKSSRVAAEGVVYFLSNSSRSLMIEINSETDFVARGDDFLDYVNQTCEIIISSSYSSIDDLNNSKDASIKNNLEELRKNYVTKLGENIQIRRFHCLDNSEGFITGYTHNNKIGAVVSLSKDDSQLSKDICMQIVASDPLALDENSIDQSLLANEKEIYKAELDKVDKKDDIKRNIMEGKIKKFISDNTLLNQPYIKDSSLTLKKILKDNNILSYTRYQLGEGIEKKQEDFADEVYSQIK
ncbi:MAG: elongation factor Ts [Gammaproteobacteria bacterium]|jgi:elongation factor Ts|nr:elongation factor Ts [Gammaproteobacteria bacterium]MBT5862898.1 elongation factor Ts [Gammaproteobacteria bacterium]MBT6734359.1 elongation factor Ts [Gammaproteobacteria bacterium]